MASGGRSYQLYAGVVTIFSHLIAITVTVLVLVWLLKFQGGFAFKSGNTQKIFNLHPFLMVVGLIVIGGEAIMAYKTMPGTRRAHKGVHIILHLLALLAGILGTYAVFKFKDETDPFFQFLLGFFTFFFSGAAMPARANILPWHTFFGMVIFLLAVCTAETGLLQRFITLGLGLNQEGLIVNFTGLLIFLFAVTVTLSVILPRNHY
ncbi:hypothetical protein G4B88_009084 [Cannabis sativa]|uniref:Cytochrome b561 domain-containing protein n=1 Tax=Cannabis sativa TaxID=3483 RepID=A0A7J6HR66_CANSA|nr:hypothetical protein G4B88_009084 [Cannabis sativa]